MAERQSGRASTRRARASSPRRSEQDRIEQDSADSDNEIQDDANDSSEHQSDVLDNVTKQQAKALRASIKRDMVRTAEKQFKKVETDLKALKQRCIQETQNNTALMQRLLLTLDRLERNEATEGRTASPEPGTIRTPQRRQRQDSEASSDLRS